MRAYAAAFLVLASLSAARVEAGPPPQLQIDGGLSVIGAAYEHPLASHISLGAEAFIFGTYFLPWFDAGDEVKGFGVGLRPTWFAHESGHGLYVTPYLRGVAVDDNSIFGADGLGFEAGAFAGWAFRLTSRLDLRIGGGAQVIHFYVDTASGRRTTTTPFVALDTVLGWRL